MSTRSQIAMQDSDGTVRAVYCHSDGYPSGVGATLAAHYLEHETIKALIDLGDLSCLGTTSAGRPFGSEIDNSKTVAYGRDRGEEDVDTTTYPSLDAFVEEHSTESWCEWLYLWNGSQWVGRNTGTGGFFGLYPTAPTGWTPVARLIEAEQEG